VIPFPKFGHFPQGVFDPAIGVLDFMCLLSFRSPQSMEFIPVALLTLCVASRQFGLEPSPVVLAGMFLLLEEQPEGFLCTKLCNTSEIFDAKAIKHFGTSKCACTEAEGTFYVVWNKWLGRGYFVIHN